MQETGPELVKKMNAVVCFVVDGEAFTVDLKSGKGKVTKGEEGKVRRPRPTGGRTRRHRTAASRVAAGAGIPWLPSHGCGPSMFFVADDVKVGDH